MRDDFRGFNSLTTASTSVLGVESILVVTSLFMKSSFLKPSSPDGKLPYWLTEATCGSTSFIDNLIPRHRPGHRALVLYHVRMTSIEIEIKPYPWHDSSLSKVTAV